MTDPNPDAEKAALAEALRAFVVKWPAGRVSADVKRTADALLADLSPAAKEMLEKAQAHDRLREELISCQVFLAAPATKAERTAKKRSIDAALVGKEPE